MSGSNVSTINMAAGSMFKLTMTNDNVFFGIPTGFPGTNIDQTFQLFLIEDGTGGRIPTFTNASWSISGSGTSSNAIPSITTNANAVTVLTFTTSPFSSSKAYGVVAPLGP